MQKWGLCDNGSIKRRSWHKHEWPFNLINIKYESSKIWMWYFYPKIYICIKHELRFFGGCSEIKVHTIIYFRFPDNFEKNCFQVFTLKSETSTSVPMNYSLHKFNNAFLFVFLICHFYFLRIILIYINMFCIYMIICKYQT